MVKHLGETNPLTHYYFNRTVNRYLSPGEWAAFMRDRDAARLALSMAAAAAVALASVGALPAPLPGGGQDEYRAVVEKVRSRQASARPELFREFAPAEIPRGRWPSSFAAAWRDTYRDRADAVCPLSPRGYTYRQEWEAHTQKGWKWE